MLKDGIQHHSRWTIYKYDDPNREVCRMAKSGLSPQEMEKQGKNPYEVNTFYGNMLVDEGIGEMWELIIGSSAGAPIRYSNGTAYLGVGSSNTAPTAGDTGLDGTDTDFENMDTGYPQQSGTTCIWKSTFGSGTANFQWEEYCVLNGTNDTDGLMLNRMTSSEGTKAAGQTWTLTLTIGLS